MIGMMYLFLTAMLALNVSGDLLNAFVLVDDSIKQTTRTVEGKNDLMYSKFEQSANDNPAKVQAYYDKATQIKEEAARLWGLIDQYKNDIVKTADGDEATPDNYKSKDNQDVASTVMLVKGGGERSKNLKKSIDNYREFLTSLVDPSDTFMIRTLNQALSTNDSKSVDGVSKSWAQEKFEYLPMAANIALMSKMQSDVRNTEADVVNYLFNKIDAGSFKFTDIEALIIPTTGSYIIRGNEYKADIMLAAYDPTMLPDVFVDGTKKPVESGRGKYSTMGTTVGKKKYNAVIQIMGPDGGQRTYNASAEYEVAEPSVVISPTKMNVFYAGVDNPVDISAPGLSANTLEVTIPGGAAIIVRQGNQWLARPNPSFAGRKAELIVTAEIDGKRQRVGTTEFRIKRVPDPIAKIGGKSSGSIKKTVLMAQENVAADMGPDFDFDLKFNVTEFSIATIKNGYYVDATSKTGRITEEQRELIRGIPLGGKLFIENVRAVGPGNDVRQLQSITLKLD